MNVGNMGAALRARDAGMASSAAHAEADQEGWQDTAYFWLAHYITARKDPFTMEDFRLRAAMFGMPQPTELRAYGALTRRALKYGLIQKVGFAPVASSHGSPKALYAKA